MSLQIVPDVDDSLAANQEPVDLDQRRRRPRDKEGHYKIVYVEGPAPGPAVAPAKACRRCDRPNPGGILHQDPRTRNVERVLCGRCQGELNAELHGYATGRAEP